MKRFLLYFFVAVMSAVAGYLFLDVDASNRNKKAIEEQLISISKLSPSMQTALGEFKIQTLESQLVSALQEENKAGVLSPQSPSVAQWAAVLELIRVTDPEVMANFAKKSPENAEFLKVFLNDDEWMELYLSSGRVPSKTDVGLIVLSDIWKDQGGRKNFRKYLPLASALASVWGDGNYAQRLQQAGKDKADPVWRFRYFKAMNEEGKLYPGFLNLKPWELRFVVGNPWDDSSYLWTAANVNIPWRRYDGACWVPTYSGVNYFGDSIQGPLYYVPWRDIQGEAERTERHGGVCGALSHYGAVAAMAHGIPAYPVGQPGHCAYGYRLDRGKWVGGFGGPDGGMHNEIFGGNAPTSYLLMEKVFGDDQKVADAYRMARIAQAQEKTGELAAARQSWGEALKIIPQHPHFRGALQSLMKQDTNMTPELWLAYVKDALPHYEGNGFAAVEMFQDFTKDIMPQLELGDKLTWLKQLHAIIAGTPTSWAVKFHPVIAEQLASFSSEPERRAFLSVVFEEHMKKGDGTNFGQALEWAVQELVEKGQASLFSEAFADAVKQSQTMDSSNHSNAPKDKLAEAYSKAIVAAEKAKSIPAFQAISQAAAPFANTEPTLCKTEMPGKLVPPTGMISFSSTSGHDSPQNHVNILKPTGGVNHTDAEKTPSATVHLPNSIDLAGVLIHKANSGNYWRMKKAKLSVSTDGATWFPIAETEDMPEEWKVEVPAGTKAKWVKVEFLNEDPQYMHISHFLVYSR